MGIIPRMPVTDSLLHTSSPDRATFEIETKLLQLGKQAIAGVDEAGRGPLAGPVTAAAVILNPHNFPDGLDDSKKLTERKREILFEKILQTSHVAWCSLNANEIDRLNIRAASLRAMEMSVHALEVKPDYAMIDGRDVPGKLTDIARAYIKGDARSLSIAAASIVAKVIRDRMMVEADKQFPEYGFASHKGYGSQKHRDAIKQHGPCPLHRRSFAPIKQMIAAL
jgi:ribonuclease HII